MGAADGNQVVLAGLHLPVVNRFCVALHQIAGIGLTA